jgi:two-component system cell cycle response regulator
MGARILIVEDNEENLKLMAYLLKAFGHTYITATDGEQGLEAIRRERPELVLCDVLLPKLDGREIARTVKSDANLRDIPIVAVTALAMVGDRDKLLAAGFDGYITKPIVPQTFVSQVEAFLRATQCGNPAAAAGSPPAQSPQVAVSPLRQGQGTILALDNMPTNLHLLRGMFQPLGYKVLGAQSIQEALELAHQNAVDLIISDVHLNNETGFDFIKIVRQDPRLKSVPFLFLSSSVTNDSAERTARALGAIKLISRPIQPSLLIDEVESCLEDRKDT